MDSQNGFGMSRVILYRTKHMLHEQPSQRNANPEHGSKSRKSSLFGGFGLFGPEMDIADFKQCPDQRKNCLILNSSADRANLKRKGFLIEDIRGAEHAILMTRNHIRNPDTRSEEQSE